MLVEQANCYVNVPKARPYILAVLPRPPVYAGQESGVASILMQPRFY